MGTSSSLEFHNDMGGVVAVTLSAADPGLAQSAHGVHDIEDLHRKTGHRRVCRRGSQAVVDVVGNVAQSGKFLGNDLVRQLLQLAGRSSARARQPPDLDRLVHSASS